MNTKNKVDERTNHDIKRVKKEINNVLTEEIQKKVDVRETAILRGRE